MAVGLLLMLAVPAFDAFDEPLDPLRWFIGVPDAPKKGALRVPKGGWIVSRGVADDAVRRVEIEFRHKGGTLEVTFHDADEPLSSPGPPIRVKRGKGVRTLAITPEGASLDGERLEWTGRLRGTFRIAARKGGVELEEVRVEPRIAGGVELTGLEQDTVLFASTPLFFRKGDAKYGRVTLMLWDAEVALLFRRGEPAFEALAAPAKGAPVLAALVQDGDAGTLALKAGSHPLAMRDWGDERRNLSPRAFASYLKEEYALFGVLRAGQRAMNAAVPGRDDLEPLVHLAVIRHSANAHAAVALAETLGGNKALAALKRALGKGVDPRRASADKLRAAAGAAARAILGEPPREWPNFTFDPASRYVSIQRAKDLIR